MADSLPDVLLTDNSLWLNLYTETSIAEETSLIIKNKSSTPVWIQVKPTIPLTTDASGWNLDTFGEASWTSVRNVPVGSKVWARGEGPVFVQVYEV